MHSCLPLGGYYFDQRHCKQTSNANGLLRQTTTPILHTNWDNWEKTDSVGQPSSHLCTNPEILRLTPVTLEAQRCRRAHHEHPRFEPMETDSQGIQLEESFSDMHAIQSG